MDAVAAGVVELEVVVGEDEEFAEEAEGFALVLTLVVEEVEFGFELELEFAFAPVVLVSAFALPFASAVPFALTFTPGTPYIP